MAYNRNDDKMLQAVLMDEHLMKFGNYTPAQIGTIYQALESDNFIINAVAQIIKGTSDGETERELWRKINEYLKQNV